MRIPWWQSIRWRLALGSVLVTLLAVTLFALTMLSIVAYYYGVDQKNRMIGLAADKAWSIGQEYAQLQPDLGGATALNRATAAMLPSGLPAVIAQGAPGQEYLAVVLDKQYRMVYPQRVLRPRLPNRAALALWRMVDPTRQQGDLLKLGLAITKGLQGIATHDAFGNGGPLAQAFVVQPIFSGGQANGDVIGILFVTPRSVVGKTAASPFVEAVLSSMLLSSFVVAAITVVAAILFARTITRPLAKLTSAARVMAVGDYSTRVTTNAQGELGELATSFNEMAAQLSRDVNELRRQELWRSELIMSITHDLATPLTAIAGLGESLIDGVNQSREDYEVTGRVIVREMLRLRRLVKDLHMMAKVEAGALYPQKKAVRLAGLVDEVLAVLVTEFERSRVEPRNLISYHLPLIQADPDMLIRVLSNLCDNALQHTPPDGTVTIEAIEHGNEMAIAITDTGQGIPAEALSRVFERFFRADTARQSSTGGSGLGLAIARAIIEAHGGRIWVENASGAGARFIFTLPLQVVDPSSLAEATTQPILRKEVRNAGLNKHK